MAGEWLSIHHKLSGSDAFMWGHQGYEYVDLGRGWQMLLFVGLLIWLFLVVRAIRPDVLEKIVASVPAKRLGMPEEIASIISWIACDEGGYATGADFSLNGGLHMG